MSAEGTTNWQAALASALEWWRDAGVDVLVDDDPRDWSARVAAVRMPASDATAAPAPALPENLADFLAWRMGENAPEAGWGSPRIAPAGPADPVLMIVTDMPEREDAETGILLSGAPGRLLDAMLAAIGLSRDSVHLASVAVARPVSGRIPGDAEARLAELIRHHARLVAPKNLLLLGQASVRAFAPDHAGWGNLDFVNQFDGITKAVASLHPRFLLERPAAKAEAWKHLQLLSLGSE